MNLVEVQAKIRQLGGDGWLFYDFHNRDKIAYKLLGINFERFSTRRWFYFIPAEGNPVKLVNPVEKNRLEELPGETVTYFGWKDMDVKLQNLLQNCRKIFMQYSPLNNIPTISCVDAGLVEKIRSFGIEILSSADLIQYFEARIDDNGIELHRQAGIKIQKIKDLAFQFIADNINTGKTVTEYDVQTFIAENFKKDGLTGDGSLPMVAINDHAADPHFELTSYNCRPIKPGDRVLFDMWARIDHPQGIYYDITWCGFVGERPPFEYENVFNIAVKARELTKNFIIGQLKKGESVFGWQADDVCRNFIRENGYGDYFLHRTGHSIHTSVHGNGANLDNLETRDDRELIPGSCFSIEPGIYKDGLGVRTEINVIIDNRNNCLVIGAEQQQLVLIK